MPTRIHVRPDETLPLKLTAAERKLVLEGLTCLPQEIEQIVQDTPSGQSVMMTLDDLDEFGGHVAADANHCREKSKARKLDAIFDKIQHLLDKFTYEERPETAPIQDERNEPNFSEQAVDIARFTGEALVAAEKKRIQKNKSKVASGALFQFKITLRGVSPPIWRRIHVKDGTLDDLHRHIQAAMGWSNYHLHEFKIRRERYGDPDLLEEGFDASGCLDSTRTKISDILPQNVRRLAFKYEYDFGDSWLHEILFEGRPPVDPQAKYPLCLEGERACPPEDCGGVWGYGGLVEAIRNPKHEEHRDLREWAGADFDPERFDPAKATKAMRR